ncbi:hypothetical protein BJ742DRAFT_742610 [Cladochytrium replicatum]|nr:hypothetical protein BJ742DRAFT_742610 [Cladochytrium replicatum]
MYADFSEDSGDGLLFHPISGEERLSTQHCFFRPASRCTGSTNRNPKDAGFLVMVAPAISVQATRAAVNLRRRHVQVALVNYVISMDDASALGRVDLLDLHVANPKRSPEYTSSALTRYCVSGIVRALRRFVRKVEILPTQALSGSSTEVPVEVHPQVIFDLPHHVLDFTPAGPSKKHGRDDDAGQAGPSSSSKWSKPTHDQKGASIRTETVAKKSPAALSARLFFVNYSLFLINC